MDLPLPRTAPASDRERKLRSVQRQRPFGMARTVIALMLREMQTTYGRSAAGYIWAVVEPAAGIALLSFIFSLGFRSPPFGTNFAIFYATGMIPFLFFNDIAGKVAGSLKFSRQLLAYPAVTFVDALIARILVNSLTQFMVAYIVFTVILVAFDTKTTLDLSKIALSLGMTLSVAVGIGTLNCFLTLRFETWPIIWGVMTRPLFLISCIFFVFDTIPLPYRDWLWYNPLVHVVGEMRSAFYPGYDAPYVSVSYVMTVATICLLAGLVFLRRYHRDLLNR